MIVKPDSGFNRRYKEISDLRDDYANLIVTDISFPNPPLSEEDFLIAAMRADEFYEAISFADDVTNYQKSISIKPIL
jgi:hypothetical protein